MGEKIEIKTCIKCGKDHDTGLPMCRPCLEEFKDFQKLATYLNNYKGTQEDLTWLITHQISDRQSQIIGNTKVVKVIMLPAEGLIKCVPKEPSDVSVDRKPWLWDRYLRVKAIIREIDTLYIGLSRVRKFYKMTSDVKTNGV